MTASIPTAMKRLHGVLRDVVEPDYGLLDKLFRMKVLTGEMVAEVRAERSIYQRCDKLLKYLSVCHDNDDGILLALEQTHQTHVANRIRRELG